MDIKIVLIIAGFLLLAVLVSMDTNRKNIKKLEKRLEKNWGKPSARKYSRDEYETISHYFKKSQIPGESYIDDITWNDLNMDEIFKTMNQTNSSVGQEYLYKMLRRPQMDSEKLKELDRLANYFDSHEKERKKIQKEYVGLGYAKSVSVSDYVDLIVDLVPGKNLIHYFSMVFLVAAFVFCFTVNASLGIMLIVAAIAFSIITYYQYKAKVEHFFVCITQIVRMVHMAESLKEMNLPELKEYNDAFAKYGQDFSHIVKNAGMLASSNVNGSLSEMIWDYVRMLTHIDLIKFNHMVQLLGDKESDIYGLMDQLGFIESSISVASFRRMLPYWSVPQLRSGSKVSMHIKEAYHPLIVNPVSNSLDADKHILLTGSNASGKSTFLKTVAINAILSQAIYTSVSREYQAPFYRVYSSMALQDDLSASNSYYIVEIKALKRILDAVTQNGKPVLCFIDEVLRGTNTVERIAASTEILRSFRNQNVLCFAATHDVELTTLLNSCYDNYHFQEEVTDNDVKFNFKLFKGPATTRNAIKLLNIIGYDKMIIDGAMRQAAYFMENGKWKN